MGTQIPLVQWLQYAGFLPAWYPAGKTSNDSRFNIPGRIAWVTMEAPGFLTLLYIMNTLPAQVGLSELPWENKAMGALVVLLPTPKPNT
jgi:3-oxo-5-alpha-steroid 4-dehydrogenase 1